jgi:hypothetical protein
MAKRQQSHGMAESVGAALGRVAAKIDNWRSQRAEISRDIQQIIAHAQGMLREVTHEPTPQAPMGSLPGSRKGKGGRPKGYIMSAATKAKLRAAWKRRKAAAAAASGQGGASSESGSKSGRKSR